MCFSFDPDGLMADRTGQFDVRQRMRSKLSTFRFDDPFSGVDVLAVHAQESIDDREIAHAVSFSKVSGHRKEWRSTL
jgi:hypothetical protein